MISVEMMAGMAGLPVGEIDRDIEEPSCENTVLADFVIPYMFHGQTIHVIPHPDSKKE